MNKQGWILSLAAILTLLPIPAFHLFGRVASVIVFVVVLIINMELIYYCEVLGYKGRKKFDVWKEKGDAILYSLGSTIIIPITVLATLFLLREVYRNVNVLIPNLIKFGGILLISVGSLAVIMAVGYGWYRLNKRLAIKHLGKGGVK